MGKSGQLAWAKILDGCFTKDEWAILLGDDAFVQLLTVVETEHQFDRVVQTGNRILLARALSLDGVVTQSTKTYRSGARFL